MGIFDLVLLTKNTWAWPGYVGTVLHVCSAHIPFWFANVFDWIGRTRNGYLTWLWKIFDYQRVYYCRSKKNDPHLQNDDSVPAADLRNESCTLGGWYLSSPARWCAWCRCLDCEHLRVAEVAPDLPSTYLHCKKKDTQDPRYMRILPLCVYCFLFLLVSPWALHIVLLFLFVFVLKKKQQQQQ